MGIAADFVLIVLAGLAGGALARWLRLPLLVGYVAAGVMVGPNTAGPTVSQIHDIELLADVGVALLLFSLGLELSLRDLLPVRHVALAGGLLQLVLTAVAAAAAATRWLGLPVLEGAWFGAIVSLSSTMVVLKTLSARGVTGTLASRVMIGLLVMQDLAVIPLLVILPQLGQPGDLLTAVTKSVAMSAAILGVTMLAGLRLLPALLRRVLAWGSRELFLVAVVATGLGTGYGMHALGLSFALGAFLAGIMLSESELSHQALSEVTPLRDIFGLLFFVSVGMLFDPRFVVSHPGVLAATVLFVLAGKAVIFGLLTRAFGYAHHAPWIVGLGLAQIGEFSFVLARAGLDSSALSKFTYDLVLSSTVLTMAVSPLLSAWALPAARVFERWFNRRERKPEPAPAPRAAAGHVIVGGYGRIGRTAARVLAAAAVPVTVVELSHPLWADLDAAGLSGVWGDLASPDVLHAAGIEGARVLVITIPNLADARLCVMRARQANPAIEIAMRVQNEDGLAEMRALGVRGLVQPEFEGGVALVEQALRWCDVEEQAARLLVSDARGWIYGRT